MGRVLRVAVVILFALSLNLFAQKAKVLAPHHPIAPKLKKPYPLPPAVRSSMVGGPWIVDASFDSAIYLRNVVETSAVTITPILYLSNGAKYTLPDVQLQPSQTTTVDLNTALANLGIAPYATLSGYVELQYTWPWDPICATIRNLDTVHSLIFDYSFRPSKALQLPNQPPPPASPQTIVAEGMWWKQEANVTGFVALANTTNQLVKASVDLSDGQGQPIAQHQVTISPHGMKTLALDELASAPTTEGGIRVTYRGNSTDILINGGLQDQVVGYSAVVPFTAPSLPVSAATNATNASVAEIGLMSGPADPMMKFPAGVVFTPYSILRNVSNTPLTATPTLWWMAGGTAQSASLPAFTLAPYETRTLDVPAMLASAGLKNYSGNVNLVFDLQGNAGGLLMAGGSVDQNNTYVFEVAPHGVSESASKSLSYWSTGNGNDTMVTLWNPTDEAQDLIFKLTFTGGHYLFPMHLEPRATQSFNISDVIQNQVPDSEGNVVPSAISEGGAVLSGSQADNQEILVVMDAGTYNVKKATCGYFCQTCNGATGFSLQFDPVVINVGNQVQQTMYANWNDGSQYNETSSSSWSSSNTSLATVSSGLMTGISSGSLTFTSVLNTPAPGYTDICEGGWYSCPVYFQSGPVIGGGNVFQVLQEVPSPFVRGTSGAMAINGTGFSSVPGPVSVQFSGTGISASSAVVTDDQDISATFNVTSNAPLGSQNLTVVFGSTSSNPLAVNVVATAPVPAFAAITDNVKQTYSNQTFTSCDNKQSENNAYGYRRCVTYQIQDSNHHPIFENFTVQESVTVIDQTGVAIENSGNSVSNAGGQFLDTLALINIGAPLQSNECSIKKQQITVSGNSNPIRVNCIQSSSTDVSITDVTSNPGLCVKGTTYHCN